LFDLVADPGEQNDLAATNPELVAPLREKLGRWRAAVAAQEKTVRPIGGVKVSAAADNQTATAARSEVAGSTR
jgi:hypothetical protein